MHSPKLDSFTLFLVGMHALHEMKWYTEIREQIDAFEWSSSLLHVMWGQPIVLISNQEEPSLSRTEHYTPSPWHRMNIQCYTIPEIQWQDVVDVQRGPTPWAVVLICQQVSYKLPTKLKCIELQHVVRETYLEPYSSAWTCEAGCAQLEQWQNTC